MKTITNNHKRLFKYFHDFTPKQQKEIRSDYDWMESDEIECENWIEYRNRIYCLSDFMSVHNKAYNPNPPDWQQGWDGYITDTFFGAVVIKLYDNPDVYTIGLVLG